MALTILFILLFSLLLLMWDMRNKYYLLFIVMMLGITLSLTTLMIEISKVSNYLIPANYLIGGVETQIYRLINTSIRQPLSTVMNIRNLGIVLYLIANVFFVSSFHNSLRIDEPARTTRRRSIRRYMLLSCYPLLYVMLYHPETALAIYLHYHSLPPDAQNAYATVLTVLDLLMSGLAIAYLAYPVVFIIHNYLRNKITFFAEQLSALAVSLGLLNISFFILFFTGIFRPSLAAVLSYGFWRLTLGTQVPVFYSSVMPLITLGVLSLVFFSIIRFRTDNLLTSFKARGVRKNLDALYSNVRNVMHSEKNQMFTIRILAQAALDAEDAATREFKLNQIIHQCDANLNEMTRTLNTIQHANMNAVNHDFVQAVEAAISKHPTKVEILRHYQSDHVPLRFDMYHITEAISNIIGNSLEALESAERDHPVISLTIGYSRSWLYFSVYDNGCGIPRKLVNKVYRPYISTKRKTNSWGIGLTYVFNVVRAHYGHFRVRSKQNQYTMVEMLLPRDKVRS